MISTPSPVATTAQKRGGGRTLRITAQVSFISYLVFVQLLFASSARVRTAVSASEIDENPRRLGRPNSKLPDEALPLSAPTCDYELNDIDEMYDKVKESLLARGFSVREGLCETSDVKFAINNPGNPYLSYRFEDNNPFTAPGEYKLKPSSAVLYLGCTPPTTKYFSWQSYALYHQDSLVYASLGDAINHLVINTTQSGSSWDGSSDLEEDPLGKLTAVVTTADGTTFSTITTALDEAGAPSGIVNLDSIPSNRVDLFDDRSLIFNTLVRPVIWTDEEQREAYFSLEGRRIIMIDAPGNQEFDPIPEPPARPNGSGNSEADQPGVLEGLAELHNNIVDSMESADYTLKSNKTFDHFPVYGAECLEELTYCLGDSSDAEYFLFEQRAAFKRNDIYLFVGTNSVATGKIVYSNLGVYHESEVRPYVATTISTDNFIMEGSANAFGVDNEKLIAYVLARKCNKIPAFLREICLEVGYDSASELPSKTSWSMFYRTYLEIATKTAPIKEELVIPQLLKFQPTSNRK